MYKTQSTIAINFVFSNEERVMHSKSGNKIIMIYKKADEVIEELFESLLNFS